MIIPNGLNNNIPALVEFGSDNGMALSRWQGIIWTNDG